jgi:hypothetical protein
MTRIAFAVGLALLAVTPILHAQAVPAAVDPGSRVRVHQGAQSVTGTFVSVDSTSLTLVTGSADTVTTSRASITGVDVSLGKKSRAGRGALIGLAIGTVAGVVTGAAVGDDSPSDCWFCIEPTKPEAALALGLTGAILGAGIGAIIGATQHGDRWQPTVLPTARVQAIGSKDQRVVLGLRIRF